MSWKALYGAGGVSVFLYIILGIIIPGVLFLFMPYDTSMNGAEILQFIASHRTWWIIIQTLTLGPSLLAIIVFIALRHINKSYAALGVVIAAACQLLFVAYYPVVMGLVCLSDQYVNAAESQKAVLSAAAEALLAQNNAFNPLYESVFAVGVLIISLVMLKGVFHKGVAYLGMQRSLEPSSV